MNLFLWICSLPICSFNQSICFWSICFLILRICFHVFAFLTCQFVFNRFANVKTNLFMKKINLCFWKQIYCFSTSICFPPICFRTPKIPPADDNVRRDLAQSSIIIYPLGVLVCPLTLMETTWSSILSDYWFRVWGWRGWRGERQRKRRGQTHQKKSWGLLWGQQGQRQQLVRSRSNDTWWRQVRSARMGVHM